jgi:cytochrome c556
MPPRNGNVNNLPPNDMRALKSTIAVAFLVAMMSHAAHAQSIFTRPTDAIKFRQGVFQVMGMHSQRIGSMVKNERPFDKTAAENDAFIIELMAKELDAAFPPGSDAPPSKAKSDIWQDPAQFKKKLDEVKISSQKLSTAAKSGDIQILRTAFSATAQSCKSCHEDFRNR